MERHLTFEELDLVIRGDIAINDPIALFSRPGIGKTEHLKALSEQLGGKVFTLAVNQIGDKEDLTGVRPVQKTNSQGETYSQQEAFPHATLMEAIQYAKDNPDDPAIIFLDEFNRTDQDVISAALSFTTERKIGTVEFPDNVRFVLAGNKNGNVVPFDDATATRFSIYNINPDLVTYLKHNADINAFVKDLLLSDPGHLVGEPGQKASQNTKNNPYLQDQDTAMDEGDDAFDPFGDESTITEERTVPRTLTKISNWLNHIGVDQSGSEKEKDALASFLQPIEAEQHNDEPTTLLQTTIESKLGQTPTATALITELIQYHEDLLQQSMATVQSPGGSMSQELSDILDVIRLDDAHKDALDDIHSRSDMVDYFESTVDNEEANTILLWSLTNEAYQTLDGDISPVNLIENIVPQMNGMSKRGMRLFNQLMGYPDIIVKRSIEVLKDVTPDSNRELSALVGFAQSMMN